MILADLNLLLYAVNTAAPQHDVARAWWDGRLNDVELVGLPWMVLLGFLRISTQPAVFARPMQMADAARLVGEWLARPSVRILHPTEKHWRFLQDMLHFAGSGGNRIMDAHLAALALEHDAKIHSNDGDFARFPGVRWRNPLMPPD